MIAEGLDALVAAIADRVDLDVTRDPGQIVPPCVFVDLPEILDETLGGGFFCRVNVQLIVPGPGDLAATNRLLELLPSVLDAVQESAATPGTFKRSPDDVHGYPAMTIPTTLTIDRSTT